MKKASSSIHAETSPSQADNSIQVSEAPSKIARILAYQLNVGSLIRFEADKLGDHCLNSTISKLSNDYGLNFVRQSETVPNSWGKPCSVIRYRLPLSERKRAINVLKMLCSAAGQRREVAA